MRDFDADLEAGRKQFLLNMRRTEKNYEQAKTYKALFEYALELEDAEVIKSEPYNASAFGEIRLVTDSLANA